MQVYNEIEKVEGKNLRKVLNPEICIFMFQKQRNLKKVKKTLSVSQKEVASVPSHIYFSLK